MPKPRTAPLSRGRTLLERTHDQIGTVVHEAFEVGEYVHLSLFRVTNAPPDGFQDVSGVKGGLTVRVTVGEHAETLVFEMQESALNGVVPLITNLYVEPYEKILMSVSRPAVSVAVHGFTSWNAVLS